MKKMLLALCALTLATGTGAYFCMKQSSSKNTQSFAKIEQRMELFGKWMASSIAQAGGVNPVQDFTSTEVLYAPIQEQALFAEPVSDTESEEEKGELASEEMPVSIVEETYSVVESVQNVESASFDFFLTEQKQSVSLQDLNSYDLPLGFSDVNSEISSQAQLVLDAIQNGTAQMDLDPDWYGILNTAELYLNENGHQVVTLVKNALMPNMASLKAKYGVEMNFFAKSNPFPGGTGHTMNGSYIDFNMSLWTPDWNALAKEEQTAADFLSILDQFVIDSRSLVHPGMSEEEAFRTLSEWVMRSFVYDYAYLGSKLPLNLKDHKAVCEGYARGIRLACLSVGISCDYVMGYADSELHAWNLVTLDGNQFWSDLTWADKDEDGVLEQFVLSQTLWSGRIILES